MKQMAVSAHLSYLLGSQHILLQKHRQIQQPPIAMFSIFFSLMAKTLNFKLSKNGHPVNERLCYSDRRKEFYNFSHISLAKTITLLNNSGLETSVFKLTFFQAMKRRMYMKFQLSHNTFSLDIRRHKLYYRASKHFRQLPVCLRQNQRKGKCAI